eukprot:CCRYP_016144-RA/>CCRYP_016144-RA protein AED:0.48 eAED:0.48 QI:0/-1/0/1/-1/0/1/0/8
MDMRFHWL